MKNLHLLEEKAL